MPDIGYCRPFSFIAVLDIITRQSLNLLMSIRGATTVGTGGDCPPTFRLGDQQCIGPPTSWP